MKNNNHSKKSNLLSIGGYVSYVAFFAALSSQAYALPTGGVVEAGAATISTPDASNVVVNQASQYAVTNWQGFDTAASETVTINMDYGNKAISVNRIGGLAPTQFDGALSTPNGGQVWLINQNGFVFGSQANVDVGSLLASTANISTDQVMNPQQPHSTVAGYHYHFDQAGNPTAAIVIKNGARIKARLNGPAIDYTSLPDNYYPAPYVTLMAPGIKMENGSKIEVVSASRETAPGVRPGANINLNAGSTFYLTSQIYENVYIDQPTSGAIVDGQLMDHAIDIENGAFLWAVVPHGQKSFSIGHTTVTIQAKVTEGAFDELYDENGNDSSDKTAQITNELSTTPGLYSPPNDRANPTASSSDIIAIGREVSFETGTGARWRGSYTNGDFIGLEGIPNYDAESEPSGTRGPERLFIREQRVPGAASTLPVVAGPSVNEDLVNQRFPGNESFLISFADASRNPNYINYDVTVRGGNNLFGAGDVPSGDLGSLAPAAGGDSSTAAAASDGIVCANEQLLDPQAILNEESRCKRFSEEGNAI